MKVTVTIRKPKSWFRQFLENLAEAAQPDTFIPLIETRRRLPGDTDPEVSRDFEPILSQHCEVYAEKMSVSMKYAKYKQVRNEKKETT